MSFFRGAAARPNSASSNHDGLSAILDTPSLKTELVLVVALCSDAMRRDLIAVFDDNPKPRRREGDEYNPAYEEQVLQYRERQQDIQSARNQSLRRAALGYFDKWQIDILRRLGEVLAVRPDAIRAGRAKAKAKSKELSAARADREYIEWAEGTDTPKDQSLGHRNEQSSKVEKVKIMEGVNTEGLGLQLLKLPQGKRTILLDSMLLLLLSLEAYTAQSRVLMAKLTKTLDLETEVLQQHESKVAKALLTSAASQMSGDESAAKRNEEDASARRWKVGVATVAGAALIGITGGLAAPILAASLGTIMGGLGLGAVASLLGPLATNALLVGALFGSYGGRMTGKVMEKYAAEVKDFSFLPLRHQAATRTTTQWGLPPSPSTSGTAKTATPASAEADGGSEKNFGPKEKQTKAQEEHKLRVAIGVSGWLTSPAEFSTPWTAFSSSKIETFALQWESEALLNLGSSLASVFSSMAWNFAQVQLMTVVAAGLWPLTLLRAHTFLDNPFAIAKTRSDKAGKVLADAIIARAQGERPVTLVGYSLGARVVFGCLQELAARDAFGLVESAVFLGAPLPSDASQWRRVRAVVAGPVVNVYSSNDYVLAFLYRASSVQLEVAGLQAIQGVAGVESRDFSSILPGHSAYPSQVGLILSRLGFEDLDLDVVQTQEASLDSARPPAAAPAEDGEFGMQDADGAIVMVDAEAVDSLLSSKNVSRQPSILDLTAKTRGKTVDEWKDDDAVPLSHAQPEGRDDGGGGIEMLDVDEDEAELKEVAPVAERDFGPDRETVRFGSANSGFDLDFAR